MVGVKPVLVRALVLPVTWVAELAAVVQLVDVQLPELRSWTAETVSTTAAARTASVLPLWKIVCWLVVSTVRTGVAEAFWIWKAVVELEAFSDSSVPVNLLLPVKV